MRYYLKQQCRELLDSLLEATGEIEKLIRKEEVDEAGALLEQCQEGAITVGNTIDSACGGGEENEGSRTVHILEDYCELLYQTHEKLSLGTSSAIKQQLKEMKTQITRCLDELQNTISTQKEVVFLPYKAAMWDSLEGVWKKAKAEPDTKAVVIPIPYYDKNPDGSFGELHYEGDFFPSDVPVTCYKDYDFEKIHPDQIYIHNPYDAYNYVTSVHPFFYSSNLKNYTDDLVYIPYFIMGETDINSAEQLKGISGFVLTAGVYNADHVFVQSENMREAYIRILLQKSKKGEAERPYWEQKIGWQESSKVTRVRNFRPEDYELPQDWQKLILRPDGSRRQVVLYNTSVTSVLKNNETMLTKIENVLEICKGRRDDVILWWRPHPLMQATLKSMRPQLLPRYDETVEQYKTEGWGIFDDTPNLDRAIACADAYYGDPSSLAQLCEKAGKPVRIQNCAVLNEEII